MKCSTLLLSLLTLFSATLSAQTVHRCAYDEVVYKWSQENPAYKTQIDDVFQQAKQLANVSGTGKRTQDTIYQIPVVVHIVHNLSTPEQNLADSIVYDQMKVLNEDFRKMNADASQIRPEFDSLQADVGIQFFLATCDPNGDPTTGIIRTVTNEVDFSFNPLFGGDQDAVKRSSSGGSDSWDTEKYLNIWVCDYREVGGPPGVLGFAYPPDGAANWPMGSSAPSPELQGVAVHYEVFGANNPNSASDPMLSIADKGRTAVHEVGHYLGLRHLWGDGFGAIIGGVDCNEDDGIDDTPNSGNNAQATGCVPTKNTCDETIPGDLPDMWENYMDYSEERCQVAFSPEQAAVMRSNLVNFRSGLAILQCGRDTTLNQEPQDTTNVSIAIVDLNNAIDLYPNPVSNTLNISLGSLQAEEVAIMDMYGRQVRSFEHVAGIKTVDVSGLSAAVYFVSVTVEGTTISRRFIVR